LEPGKDNTFDVRLTNAWGASSTGQTKVHYNAPPRVRSLTSSQAVKLVARKPWTDKPAVDLVAEVESLAFLGRPQATLGGVDRPAGKITIDAVKGGAGRQVWRVLVRGVPLHEGDNLLTLSARNADGLCLEPRALTIHFEPTVPPPVVELGVKDHTTVKKREYAVPFHIRSQRPLQTVELIVSSGASRKVIPLPDVAGRQKRAAGGGFVLEDQLKAPLARNHNDVWVHAVNDKGVPQDSKGVVLSYVPDPAVLVVKAPRQKVWPQAKYTLKGSITWEDPDEAKRVDQALSRLVVYVNGFRQGPAVPAKAVPGRNERDFTVDVVLNRRTNLIDVTCPALPHDQGGLQEIRLDCDDPAPPSTLHLLIVGVNKESREIKGLALKALGVGGGPLTNGIFPKIIMYPNSPGQQINVLADNVHKYDVVGTLISMQQAIAQRKSPNDVVLIYWLGTEASEEGELYLNTSQSLRGVALSRSGVSLRYLLESCQKMLGAQVLLFDVARGGEKRLLAVDLATTRAAVLRGTWLRKEPYYGLLAALQGASAGKVARLKDVVQAAEKLRNQSPYKDLHLFNNLTDVPALAALMLSEGPPPPR
jgi:hypothetical protein